MTQSSKMWNTMVTGDTTRDLSLGHTLKFLVLNKFNSEALRTIQNVDNLEIFNGAILGLLLKTATGSKVVGSGAMIGPGLVVTALHNLEDELQECQRGDVVPYFFGIREQAVMLWRVHQLVTANDDILFATVNADSALPGDSTFYQFSISTRCPEKGEKLTILGFRCDVQARPSTPGL